MHDDGHTTTPARYLNEDGTETIDNCRRAPGGDIAQLGWAVRQIIRYTERAGKKEGATEEQDLAKAEFYAQYARHLLVPQRFEDPRSSRTDWIEDPFEGTPGILSPLKIRILQGVLRYEATEPAEPFKLARDADEWLQMSTSKVKRDVDELARIGLLQVSKGTKEAGIRGRLPYVYATTWLVGLISTALVEG